LSRTYYRGKYSIRKQRGTDDGEAVPKVDRSLKIFCLGYIIEKNNASELKRGTDNGEALPKVHRLLKNIFSRECYIEK